MAILKPLTKRQAAIIEAAKRVKPIDVKLTELEVTRRAELIASHTNVTVIKSTGKPLKAQKWYQPDYRSATPKGVTLLSDRVRGTQKRWANV